MYFEITVQLCDRYHALDPIKIRQTPAHEIYLLYGRSIKRNKRLDKNNGSCYKDNTNNNGRYSNTRIIKKKAGDDWF